MYYVLDHLGHRFSSIKGMCNFYGVDTAYFYNAIKDGKLLRDALKSSVLNDEKVGLNMLGQSKDVYVDFYGNKFTFLDKLCEAYGVNFRRELLKSFDIVEATSKLANPQYSDTVDFREYKAYNTDFNYSKFVNELQEYQEDSVKLAACLVGIHYEESIKQKELIKDNVEEVKEPIETSQQAETISEKPITEQAEPEKEPVLSEQAEPEKELILGEPAEPIERLEKEPVLSEPLEPITQIPDLIKVTDCVDGECGKELMEFDTSSLSNYDYDMWFSVNDIKVINEEDGIISTPLGITHKNNLSRGFKSCLIAYSKRNLDVVISLCGTYKRYLDSLCKLLIGCNITLGIDAKNIRFIKHPVLYKNNIYNNCLNTVSQFNSATFEYGKFTFVIKDIDNMSLNDTDYKTLFIRSLYKTSKNQQLKDLNGRRLNVKLISDYNDVLEFNELSNSSKFDIICCDNGTYEHIKHNENQIIIAVDSKAFPEKHIIRDGNTFTIY